MCPGGDSRVIIMRQEGRKATARPARKKAHDLVVVGLVNF
jgi:hypothetical protein